MLPITEQENPKTASIDKVSTIEALRLINDEDKLVAAAVEKVLPDDRRNGRSCRRTPAKWRTTFLCRNRNQRRARRARCIRNSTDIWRFI